MHATQTMFKTLPDGVEIYFAWPSRTARIVPNGSVKSGIVLRDNALRTLVALMALIAALLQEKSLTIGLAMGVLGVAVFVERNRYLSNLSKLSLELVTTKSKEASVRPTKSVQITGAEIDKAYVRDYDKFGGVLTTVTGVLVTVGFSYLLFTEVPLLFSLPLMACGLAIAYVGLRIFTGKRAKQRKYRHARHKDAI